MPIVTSGCEVGTAKLKVRAGRAATAAHLLSEPAPRGPEKDFFALRDFIRNRFGLHFPPNKYQTLRAKLIKTCKAGGMSDFSELARELFEHPNSRLIPVLAENVTTNFTHFFREEKAFRFLQNQVLPFLRTPAPRFWSAASTLRSTRCRN